MFKYYILPLLLFMICSANIHAEQKDTYTKKERNFIKKGNKAYQIDNYGDAETAYNKALEQNQYSDIATFNLASALLKQAGKSQADSPTNPSVKADSLFSQLTQSQNTEVAEQSFYNLGNIAFEKSDYAKSIDMYKKALRINPENDKARENLRLAQLKLQEQQQNKDKNKDNNKDNNKQDEQQDKNKDNQQDNNKNQQQNQDNKDEDKEDNNGQQNQQQSQESKKDKQEQKPQSNGISDANAEKILKTMENEENATRKKVNDKKKQEEMRNASRRQITNQW